MSEIITNHPNRVTKVFVAQDQTQHRRIKELMGEAKANGIVCQVVPKAKLDSMTQGQPHQGVVAYVAPRPVWNLGQLIQHLEQVQQTKAPFLLALDGVTDVHNIGAIIRVAVAAGVNAIILPKMGSGGLSPMVSKTSAGYDSVVNVVVVPNLAQAMSTLKDHGIWWLGTTLGPKSMTYDTYPHYYYPTGVVMGSEEKGLRPIIEQQCDQLITIPMAQDGVSLNVSVATGVVCFELQRQRALHQHQKSLSESSP